MSRYAASRPSGVACCPAPCLRFWMPVVILLAALPIFLSAAVVEGNKAPANQDTFAQIAQAVTTGLRKTHVKHVIVLDFIDVNRQITPFGSWLADRLSAADTWPPIDVLDRKQFAGELNSLRNPDTNEVDLKKVRDFSQSHDVALVTGSFAAADGGIGVTISTLAFRKGPALPSVSLRAKIELTDEIRSHMPGPLESLVPKDGIYNEGEGGVTMCQCDNHLFDFSNFANTAGRSGAAAFSMVINPDGHISDVSACKATGVDFCKDAVEAPEFHKWDCKPAQNIDGKLVPVRKYLTLAVRIGP